MRKNKGFKIVELLAVIVIMEITIRISVPLLGNLMKSQSPNAFEYQRKLIKKSTGIYADQYKKGLA